MKNLLIILLLITTFRSPAQNKETFSSLLGSYLSLKTALTQDDARAAQIHAQKISAAATQLSGATLAATEQAAWKKYGAKITTGAGSIQAAGDIEAERKQFIHLSKNMYELVKALHAQTTDLYYQFCPMANDGKGAYWLSNEAAVVNPYYGASMLHCGSVKETLKAK